MLLSGSSSVKYLRTRCMKDLLDLGWALAGELILHCSKPSGSSFLISESARWDPELTPVPGDSRAAGGVAGRELNRTHRVH